MGALLRRRLVDPLLAQLTQGVSPAKLALTLALGVGLGVFPVLGTTTLLCAAAGVLLRLNQPAIQVANYVAYPLQVALYLPFFQLGAWLFGEPALGLSLDGIRAELSADTWGTVVRYAGANLRATAAWLLVAPPAILLVRLAARPLLARLPLPPDEAPKRDGTATA
jgi:hypothetical protein